MRARHMDPRGILFDLYGTLLVFGDLNAAWEEWFQALYQALQGLGMQMGEAPLRRRCDGFFSRPEPRWQDDGLTVVERRFQEFCTELEHPLEGGDLRELADAAVTAWQRHVEVDPEAAAVLEEVGGRRPLALVTNFDHPRHVHRLLGEWEIQDCFDVVVVSGDVGVNKPDPAIFDIALKEMELLPQDVIHVGDSADDVNGARAAGIEPVLIRRPRSADQPVVLDYHANGAEGDDPAYDGAFEGVTTISSLSALIELLD